MAFDYYSPVTINAGQVPSAQTDFPVLISVTDARFKTVANGGHVKNANGYDIRPYADSMLLTAITGYELERYNGGTGEVIMWVKRSSVSDGLVTYMAYGDSSVNTNGSSATTWSNSFLEVYHLEDGTTLSVADALGVHNGTNHGTTATSGQIDGAAALVSTSSQYIDLGTPAGAPELTFSAWINATSFPNAYNSVLFRNNGNSTFYGIMVKSNGKVAWLCSIPGIGQDGTGSHTLLPGTWYHLVMSYDSNAAGLITFVNGSSDITHAGGAGGNNANATQTDIGRDNANGGRFWNGKIDEARIARVGRSANWITTEYNNQSSPITFETLGDEVSSTPAPTPEPIIVIPEERHVGGARGWKKRLLDEKLWMDKQDDMFLKIANEDDLEVVHVLTDFLSRV